MLNLVQHRQLEIIFTGNGIDAFSTGLQEFKAVDEVPCATSEFHIRSIASNSIWNEDNWPFEASGGGDMMAFGAPRTQISCLGIEAYRDDGIVCVTCRGSIAIRTVGCWKGCYMAAPRRRDLYFFVVAMKVMWEGYE